jgi:putative FmdB family regulatory protein
VPLYDFRCNDCRSVFEERTGSEDPPPACPACGRGKVERLLSPFAGPYTVMPRGMAAKRSDATRKDREEQRAERKAARQAQRDNG